MKKTDAEVVVQYSELQLLAKDVGLFVGWSIQCIGFADEEFVVCIYRTDPKTSAIGLDPAPDQSQEPLFASTRIDECDAFLKGYMAHYSEIPVAVEVDQSAQPIVGEFKDSISTLMDEMYREQKDHE